MSLYNDVYELGSHRCYWVTACDRPQDEVVSLAELLGKNAWSL